MGARLFRGRYVPPAIVTLELQGPISEMEGKEDTILGREPHSKVAEWPYEAQVRMSQHGAESQSSFMCARRQDRHDLLKQSLFCFLPLCGNSPKCPEEPEDVWHSW